MKTLTILGGTFDPITNAHMEIAEKISKKYNTDILFWIGKNTRWKENITNSFDRLNMLKLAIKGHDNYYITTKELDKLGSKTNYCIDTIFDLLEEYKDTKFNFIIGTDQLEVLDKWMEIDTLASIVQFIVVRRPSYPINKINLEKYHCIDSEIEIGDISSTNVRKLESKDVPSVVYEYILEHGLYFKNKLVKMLNKERFEHSERVADTAAEIALENGYDLNKAYVAGLLHDCAKNLKYEESIKLMSEYEYEHINEGNKLYHQYLAPYIALREFDIKDKEILDAIKCHDSAKLNLTTLDKIIYCADKVEPGREFETEFLRNKCKEDINIGFIYTYKENMEHIMKKSTQYSDECKKIYKKCCDYLEMYKLQLIAKLLDDRFGLDIKIYDISSINPLVKYAINCSCQNSRQLSALGNDVADALIKNRLGYHHIENQPNSGWVLVDCIDVIVNLFRVENRSEYNLDENYKSLPQIDFNKLMNLKYKI